MDSRGFRSSRYNTLYCVSKKSSSYEYEDCDNNVRNKFQRDAPQNLIHFGKPENIKRCNEKHHDNKPFHESADKSTDTELKSCAIECIHHFGILKYSFDFKGFDDLRNNLAQDRPDDPSQNKDNKSSDDLRDIHHHACPYITECLHKSELIVIHILLLIIIDNVIEMTHYFLSPA